MLESNPLKSRILVKGLAVHGGALPFQCSGDRTFRETRLLDNSDALSVLNWKFKIVRKQLVFELLMLMWIVPALAMPLG